MFHSNTFFRRSRAGQLLGLVLTLGLICQPAALAASKGKTLYRDARKAELRKEYDKALDLYEQAQRDEPENQVYQLAVRRMKFVAGQAQVDQGHKLLEKGSLLEAAAAFEKAIQIDPASTIAEQELKRTLELVNRRSKQKPAAPGATPGPAAKPDEAAAASTAEALNPVLAARKETEALLETIQGVPKLKPISTQPINLKINNNSKVIFETIGKLTGVNVLFDPEYQDRRVTLELTNANLYEALEYVSTIARAFWKPLSANAIFVTNDNTTKRRDYEEQVLKTFYLTNTYTAQELQEIATAVRSAADIRRLFTVNSLNAMVVRAEADKVALAEKVIHDIDKARAEVVIDVLVLEASVSKTRELGITPLSGSTPGINIPLGFSPINALPVKGGDSSSGGGVGGTVTPPAAPSSAIRLSPFKLGGKDYSIVLPGAGIKALMSGSDTRVLQSPRIRGFDGYKASLRIGDRIPIATGSFQPGIGGVGINPLVNTQFNYQDVGVNIDLTPRVHAGKEISMHIEIEISNVRNYVDIGGISQPVIGQRKIIHDIRLKESEANVIGGLMQMQTSRSVSGVPGLAQIPILGRLFSNERLEKSENEILIVLVPHVVRVPEMTDVNLKGISTGTEQQVKVTFTPPANNHPALPPVPAPAAPPPAALAPVPQAPAVPALVPPAPQPPPPAAAGAPVALLRFDRPKVQEAPGGRIILNLLAENVSELFAAPLRITFDPKAVQLADARKGALLSSDGQDVILSKNIENDRGEATVRISRFPGAPGVSGTGILLVLEFEALAPGKANIQVTGVEARNVRLEPIKLEGAGAEITVQ